MVRGVPHAKLYMIDAIPIVELIGQFADPDMYFYLCGSHDMVDEAPAPKVLVPIIAQIHKPSMGKSPLGAYGFHVTAHLANIPNDNTCRHLAKPGFSRRCGKCLSSRKRHVGRTQHWKV